MDSAASPDQVLVARGVAKTFAGVQVLKGVDLEISAGEVHALVGGNGSGKSTFIKILSGYYDPDPGTSVVLGGRDLVSGSAHDSRMLGLRFVHQDLGLVGSSSVLDNMFLASGFPTRFGAISARRARSIARESLALVGLADIQLDLPVHDLAPAARAGVAIARALQDDADAPAKVLVLDEPTATLPKREVDRLMEIVATAAATGLGVLYVSHRLEEVLQCSDRVTVLRDGEVAATRSTSSLDRAELIHLLIGPDSDEPAPPAGIDPLVADVPVLEVTGLAGPTIAGVDLDCRPGEVLGVAGIAGSGSEALLGAVFGAAPRLGGVVEIAGAQVPPLSPRAAIAAGMAYLPPDRPAMSGIMEMTTVENLTLASLRSFFGIRGWCRTAEKDEATRWFESLGVAPRASHRMRLATLSGGNQQKILMAKWLRLSPKVLLLDEPTQGVDVHARAMLHAELLAAARDGAAVICQSTDVEELAAICHRVIVMNHGTVVATLEGSNVTVTNISRACLNGAA